MQVGLDLLFFFKQKTAYEMRISDWSSDVCSSDLQSPPPQTPLVSAAVQMAALVHRDQRGVGAALCRRAAAGDLYHARRFGWHPQGLDRPVTYRPQPGARGDCGKRGERPGREKRCQVV